MKICVTSQGDSLESTVDPRFGRCAWFLIVDTDSMSFEAIDNANAQNAGGVGVQSGQLMAEKGVDVVLTGNAGPNAFQTLNAADIQLVTGVSGSVLDAVEAYKKGKYQTTDNPTVKSHFGIKGEQSNA